MHQPLTAMLTVDVVHELFCCADTQPIPPAEAADGYCVTVHGLQVQPTRTSSLWRVSISEIAEWKLWLWVCACWPLQKRLSISS